MNHFTVARTRPGPDGAFGFQNDDLAPVQGQRPRDGQSDDTGTDDGAIEIVHPASLAAERGSSMRSMG